MPDLRYPGPWQFHRRRYGFANVVTDRGSRYIVSSVPAECGPLLAAAPQLRETQERMMAKRANAKTVEVKSSHVAYMSHPKESAMLIEEAATSAPVNQ